MLRSQFATVCFSLALAVVGPPSCATTASASPSGSEPPLDLFDAGALKAKPVAVYQSKQPPMLPPESANPLDLFALRPSPTVEQLKAHAEQRLLPAADKPLVIGMCAEGVIANYDEAYRLSLKTGKPLKVLVGQPVEAVMREGKKDDGYLKCRVDDGMDPRFPAKGVYVYAPRDGGLVQSSVAAAAQPPPATSCPCGVAGCQCGCAIGAPCRCIQSNARANGLGNSVPTAPQFYSWPVQTQTPTQVYVPQVIYSNAWGYGSSCANGRCGG